MRENCEIISKVDITFSFVAARPRLEGFDEASVRRRSTQAEIAQGRRPRPLPIIDQAPRGCGQHATVGVLVPTVHARMRPDHPLMARIEAGGVSVVDLLATV